jgi:hypothetical protein
MLRPIETDLRAPRRTGARALSAATRCVVCVAVWAVLGAAVADAGPRAPTELAAWEVSPNWSGYALTGPEGTSVSYSRITGTWKVPSVACGPRTAGAASAVWVGLGGFRLDKGTTRGRVEQVGANADCDAAGNPKYYAWFEIVPFPAYTIKSRVSAGDTITASVRIHRPALVELTAINRTRHWTFTRKITWGAMDVASAEWIVEAPANCVRFQCAEAPLANFGAVTISKIGVTSGSASGTLTTPAWTAIPIRLVPGSGLAVRIPTPAGLGSAEITPALKPSGAPFGATPGKPSADGTAFRVSWIPKATG